MNWDEPATGRQKLCIAKLCMAAGIRDEIEQQPMNRYEAREVIYRLRGRLRARR